MDCSISNIFLRKVISSISKHIIQYSSFDNEIDNCDDISMVLEKRDELVNSLEYNGPINEIRSSQLVFTNVSKPMKKFITGTR